MNIADVRGGMLVRYHPIIGREDDGRIYEVQSFTGGCVGWVGHEPVVWLKGKAGAVSCSAISPVESEHQNEVERDA